MAEYIKRSDALELAREYYTPALREEAVPVKAIKNIPSADVAEVKHGKWELAEDGWYCSSCELYPPFDCDPEEKGIPYCPNCGADMRPDGET